MLRVPSSVADVVITWPVRKETRSQVLDNALKTRTRLPAPSVRSTSPFRVMVSTGTRREIAQMVKTNVVVLPVVVMIGGGEQAVAYQAPAEAAAAATMEKAAPDDVVVAPSAW